MIDIEILRNIDTMIGNIQKCFYDQDCSRFHTDQGHFLLGALGQYVKSNLECFPREEEDANENICCGRCEK